MALLDQIEPDHFNVAANTSFIRRIDAAEELAAALAYARGLDIESTGLARVAFRLDRPGVPEPLRALEPFVAEYTGEEQTLNVVHVVSYKARHEGVRHTLGQIIGPLRHVQRGLATVTFLAQEGQRIPLVEQATNNKVKTTQGLRNGDTLITRADNLNFAIGEPNLSTAEFVMFGTGVHIIPFRTPRARKQERGSLF